ncbi:MAG: Hsp70 family protein [Anaerolineaceae bacterium]
MEKQLAVGIDLGTTFSSIAIINENNEAEIIPNSEGGRLTPSVVFFDNNISVVGEIAKDNSELYPERIIKFVKREMGNPAWFYKHEEKRLTPTDISALILRKLKIDAELYIGQKIRYAVITVPAYFDDSRRRATIDAGSMAGFEVLQLINEPTAAAIAFGINQAEKDETVLVYDLGGGTFDVTLLKLSDKGNKIEILASEGDHQLGGKDFDDAIIRFCVECFYSEHDFDPTSEPHDLQELRNNSEKAKIELSNRDKTALLVRSNGQRSRVLIEREQFENLIKPKLDTTLSLIRNVLKSSHSKPALIDRILLIGGSTRIPLVKKMLKDFFQKEPDDSINPDEAVSLGAAILAVKKLSEISPESLENEAFEKFGGLQITDVVSHSIGIDAFIPGSNQKINSILIKKNSPIPYEVSKEFVTTIPNQTAIKITIYQGEFQDLTLCNPIGDFFLKGLPNGRPSGRKVRVTISCTKNGVVEVKATDIESGLETQTQVDYSIGNSKQQISAKKLWLQSQIVE